ncbi:YPDG domain-containing protein [Corynebacterium suedekumii]|nr:YPDG domain-containing protein [Corynebacterium suedekumii]
MWSRPVIRICRRAPRFAPEEGFTAPEGWAVEVDPNTGAVSVTPPEGANPGDSITVPVTVTYPDGTTDTANATVTVGGDDAANNNPDYNVGTTTPGTPVTVPQSGDDDLPEGTTFAPEEGFTAPEGWTVEVDPNTGAVTVTPSDLAIAGETVTVPVVVTYPDGTSETIDATVVVSNTTVDDGSSVSDRCVAAGLTVGLPLLFLIPLGIASQVNIPGLSPMISQVQGQIEQTNTNLQRNLGIFDPNAAQFVQQFNAQLNQNGPAGQVLGGAALVAAGLLASAYLYDNCVGGGSSTSSTSSGSSGSSTSSLSSE